MKSRLIFAFAATLLLSNCGLIGTALRLAPYALMFADEDGKGTTASKTLEMRGHEVQAKGDREIHPTAGSSYSQVAFKP
ncbi:MAG: hypothetical protein NTY98_24275 [Verrucomicrobia bacterium]|nr:hypothetical protein [Verrucomicrobiota bacterium]